VRGRRSLFWNERGRLPCLSRAVLGWQAMLGNLPLCKPLLRSEAAAMVSEENSERRRAPETPPRRKGLPRPSRRPVLMQKT
jgi:hypothetical protein